MPSKRGRLEMKITEMQELGREKFDITRQEMVAGGQGHCPLWGARPVPPPPVPQLLQNQLHTAQEGPKERSWAVLKEEQPEPATLIFAAISAD
ncbi:hypothetical protein H920_12252 [Fukomys damarensis]|uniref:Uncharacterized protein n=1 Tax=Fukomys damarensis TaxID=885580 RepID=A0A091D2N8_FUKDA|nr:hypothetical protein H920_12252 [Fukomys damarensis]